MSASHAPTHNVEQALSIRHAKRVLIQIAQLALRVQAAELALFIMLARLSPVVGLHRRDPCRIVVIVLYDLTKA